MFPSQFAHAFFFLMSDALVLQSPSKTVIIQLMFLGINMFLASFIVQRHTDIKLLKTEK